MSKSEGTRQRILDAAARLFRQKGYEAASLREISNKASVRPPAVYYYFNSKEALLAEVLDIGIDRIHDAVRTAVNDMPAQSSYRELVEVAIYVHLATLLKHTDYTAANIINFGLAPKKVRAQNHVRREVYGNFWRKLLGDAQKAGEIGAHVDLSLLRLFLIGALDWSHEWYQPKQKSIKQMAEGIGNIVFDGIK